MFPRKKAPAGSPTLTPVRAPAPASDTAPATVESLGQQLRGALSTRRLHSLSLCDHEANVLWLSEGALGPDEHALVTEGLDVLGSDTQLPTHEIATEDGRLAVFLPVRAPQGKLVGVAMLLADGKGVGDDTMERMTGSAVRAVMLRLAVLMKPAAPAEAERGAQAPQLELTASPVAEAAPSPAPARIEDEPEAALEEPVLSAQGANDILEFELSAIEVTQSFARPTPAAAAVPNDMLTLEFMSDEPAAPSAAPVAEPARQPQTPAAPEPVVLTAAAPAAAAPLPATVSPAPVLPPPAAVSPRRPAPTPAPAPAPPAASDSNFLIEMLPYAKLRAGGQMRRYQITARTPQGPREPAACDALLLQRLLAFLSAHRGAWNSQPTSFSISLSIASIEDERFLQKFANALNQHGISSDTVGFEIAEALCTQRRAQVERFIAQCDKVRAWVVIDEFSFDSQVLPLLRSRALRLVKIDSRLTGNALKDKLSQALVVASVQAARVMGIHCSAGKVDSRATLQWLAAIGCDFAQGMVLGDAQPLESLLGGAAETLTGLAALPQGA